MKRPYAYESLFSKEFAFDKGLAPQRKCHLMCVGRLYLDRDDVFALKRM